MSLFSNRLRNTPGAVNAYARYLKAPIAGGTRNGSAPQSIGVMVVSISVKRRAISQRNVNKYAGRVGRMIEMKAMGGIDHDCSVFFLF
jgi:hypothetical protein